MKQSMPGANKQLELLSLIRENPIASRDLMKRSGYNSRQAMLYYLNPLLAFGMVERFIEDRKTHYRAK